MSTFCLYPVILDHIIMRVPCKLWFCLFVLSDIGVINLGKHVSLTLSAVRFPTTNSESLIACNTYVKRASVVFKDFVVLIYSL